MYSFTFVHPLSRILQMHLVLSPISSASLSQHFGQQQFSFAHSLTCIRTTGLQLKHVPGFEQSVSVVLLDDDVDTTTYNKSYPTPAHLAMTPKTVPALSFQYGPVATLHAKARLPCTPMGAVCPGSSSHYL